MKPKRRSGNRRAEPRGQELRDRCGWCVVGKHARCQRVYAYPVHTVVCACAADLHGLIPAG